MPAIALGTASYKRADNLLPQVRLENVFFEQSPTNLKTGGVLLTRPNLSLFATAGTGPIRGFAWEDDVYFDNSLAVSGNELYRIPPRGGGSAELLGVIPGPGMIDIAFSPDLTMIASGAGLVSTNFHVMHDVTFPDDQAVVSVGYINGYFLAVPAFSHRMYYTDLLTGHFTGTRFISAERYPDDLKRIVITSDEIWAFGSESVEVFVPTGIDTSDSPPFQRVEGRLYKSGTLNAETIVEVDNTVFWVGQSRGSGVAVYRADSVPVVISDPGIAERIARADRNVLKAWACGHMGHSFYVLSMGEQGTWVYDITTQQWHEWSSYGRPQWRAHIGAGAYGGRSIAGDDELGVLWELSDLGVTDGDDPFVQVFTGGVPADSRVANSSISLECAVGQTDSEFSPQISLRHSDDQGRTWIDDDACSLGGRGEFDARVRWERLGLIYPPGRIFEWRVTDPVRLRVSNARVNDPF
jgi:hypothetical protein